MERPKRQGEHKQRGLTLSSIIASLQSAGHTWPELKKATLPEIGVFYCWYVYGLRNKAKEQHYRRMALINDIRAATQYQQKDFGRYTKQLERGYQSTLPKSKNIKPITPETIEAKFGIKIRNKRKKVK